MGALTYDRGQSSFCQDEERNRDAEWSIGVQTCEAVDDVMVTRAMYGWRQPPGSAKSVPSYIPQNVILPKYFARRQIHAVYLLLCLCLFCAAGTLCLLLISVFQQLRFATGLLLGSALGFFVYELWLVTRRIMRNRS
jgi:hypothetical protein